MCVKNIHVQIDTNIIDKVQQLSKDDKRTLRATIEILLEEALKSREANEQAK